MPEHSSLSGPPEALLPGTGFRAVPRPTDARSELRGWQALLERASVAVGWLSNAPGLLFAYLFFLNAAANFYAGLEHDASVYSLQALNAATGGAFSGDLFLKYGSQDRYSLFSALVGPIVGAFGVERSFFALYLCSNALWLWAAARFLRSLLKDPVVSTIAAMFVAVAPMWFGGLSVFHVAEPFFTPRLPACALTLLGLEQLLHNRLWRAMVLMASAALLHPVMALPGFMLWGAHVLLTRLRPWQSVAILAAGLATLPFLLIDGSISGLPLATMDDTWREVIRRAAPYNFPDEWAPGDWVRVLGSVSIVAAAAAVIRREEPAISQLLWLVSASAIVGLLLTVASSRSSNALLFQAQPYRALWLAAFLEGPAGIWLVLRSYASESSLSRLGAIAVLCYLGRGSLPMPQLALVFVVLAIVLIARCVTTRLPLRAVFHERAVPGVLMGMACAVIPLLPFVGVASLETISEYGLLSWVRLLLGIPGPIALCLFASALIVGFHRHLTSWRPLPVLLVMGGLAVHSAASSAVLAASTNPTYAADQSNIEFARAYISAHRSLDGKPLTVYADFVATQTIWVDWEANSYFGLTQTIGVMFSRENAIEAMRRARLVRPFELRNYSPVSELSDNLRLMVQRTLAGDDDAPPASHADLRMLCMEPELDAVMTDGPALSEPAASNGSIHIYDCHRLRSASF